MIRSNVIYFCKETNQNVQQFYQTEFIVIEQLCYAPYKPNERDEKIIVQRQKISG